jgi:hypothetical protein
MTFQIRHQLLQVLSNNVTAYEIAHAFVGDDADKFEVFKIALAESRQSHGTIETQASSAVDVAEVRWKVLSPPVAE